MLGTNYECIMVAYNLSEISKEVLNVAINIKKAHPKSRLIIAHVIEEKVSNINVDQEKKIETVRTNGFLLEGIQIPPVTVEKNKLENHHTKITDSVDQVFFNVKEELKTRNMEAEYELLEGAPADSLCDFAKKKDADLIVVGNAGKNAIKELLLGTVAEKLVKNAPCHVLVVK
ncbi:universal stress protein [Bacillus sp. 31A1R]|uniref:Universal stress protein n=1 Tax=Robertmurraya mangrovi TaxID=3098077 RepID=A0ABU5ISM2_9BACI|nr:universal stress protein [Bacillus sp. 31A1R]MDZ5470156.1 universal stress protein [Bacillus sp. 31A1R]